MGIIKKILIVDDSTSARFFIKGCIPKDRGYEFFEASDGAKAVDSYKTNRPDVTFMDLTMPVMTGFEAIELIKEFDPQAVIIVLTADIQAKTVERVTALGVAMVLKKPPVKSAVEEALVKVQGMLG
ncbi:MAG: response regulator [Candidatus Magnetominusculus sp. LBB02]|nr:response regulator [Candidatus Magnetominusculus sp. LBB02]